MDRAAFLERMAAARIVVTLPLPSEGFFLPALETMALGRAVIYPDCVGNRSFCIDGQTCLMPLASPKHLEAAVVRLLSDPPLMEALALSALAKASQFDIHRERTDFLRILDALA